MTDIPEILLCNCLAVRQAARFVSRLYDKHLTAVGLTGSQFVIFAMLNQNPGITMQDLGTALVMDRTTLVRGIKPLLRDGFVYTAPSKELARKMTLYLSKEGEHKFSASLSYWTEAQKHFENILGKPRALALRNELSKVTKLQQ